MHSIYKIGLSLAIITPLFLAFQNFSSSNNSEYDAVVSVDPSTNSGFRKSGFFGANTLYWVDTDDIRNQPSTSQNGSGSLMADYYKKLGVKRLRFPGGTAANNYDWPTNTLEDPDLFPKEPNNKKERLNRMDTLEFCRFKNQVGKNTEANLVVNIYGAYRDKRVWYDKALEAKNNRLSIQRAKDWVEFTNDKHKNICNVTDWEIGNEEYYAHFTAAEYAELLIRYSKAMKSIDPKIKIGAVGPWYSSGSSNSGFLDQLTTEGLREFRKEGALYDNCTKKKTTSWDYADCLNQGQRPDHPSPVWWETVAQIAGDHFDFIIVHRYDVRRQRNIGGPGIPLADESLKIQKMVKNHLPTPKELPMYLTEWNVGSQSSDDDTAIEHALAISEMMVNYLKAGIYAANYWPALLKGHPYTIIKTSYNKNSGDDFEILSSGSVFQLFSKKVHRQLIAVKNSEPSLDTLASQSENGKIVRVFIVNRKGKKINVLVPGFNKRKNVSGVSFVGDKNDSSMIQKHSLKENSKMGKLSVDLPAHSISMIEIQL
ncbi:MAG: hypothetical protein IT287_00030 [Bdellovibrionaceae bacterium]|nr:hypothetical protein [Pseudobdellovibrionaceae bacterium]